MLKKYEYVQITVVRMHGIQNCIHSAIGFYGFYTQMALYRFSSTEIVYSSCENYIEYAVDRK